MKDLYSALDKIFTEDAKLRGLLGYKEAKDVPIGQEGLTAGVSSMNIRRGFQTEGKWSKLLTYYFQPDTIIDASVSPNIRELPLIVVFFDRDSDLNLFDIQERLIQLLDEKDLTVSNLSVKNKVFCYGCYYAGQLETPYYDEIQKSYRMSIRFLVRARKEN